MCVYIIDIVHYRRNRGWAEHSPHYPAECRAVRRNAGLFTTSSPHPQRLYSQPSSLQHFRVPPQDQLRSRTSTTEHQRSDNRPDFHQHHFPSLSTTDHKRHSHVRRAVAAYSEPFGSPTELLPTLSTRNTCGYCRSSAHQDLIQAWLDEYDFRYERFCQEYQWCNLYEPGTFSQGLFWWMLYAHLCFWRGQIWRRNERKTNCGQSYTLDITRV